MYLCNLFATKKMLIVYTPRLTNRIGYTLQIVLGNVLHTPFEITTSEETFQTYQGAKICYGPKRICDDAVWIKSSKLLFESSIEDKELGISDWEDTKILFPVYGQDLDFPFDLLAATFFLVTRYEEYLPHRTDVHGRFMASESVGYQHGFLDQPIVDIWVDKLSRKIAEKHPDWIDSRSGFDLLTTIDIDAAYCYKRKGFARTCTGIVKDLIRDKSTQAIAERLSCIRGKKQDPFDTFDYIIETNQKHKGSQLIFFALLAEYGLFDKNISYHDIEFTETLRHLADYAKVGIHTSYASFKKPELIDKERARLHDILHHNIVRNRSHFLLLSLPFTYRELIRAGISHDYTMGYAEALGFRAGISVPFPFYDLISNSETSLIVHPFAMMDTTLRRYLKLSPEEGWAACRKIMENTAKVQGSFSSIYHNENLSEQFGWEGWRMVFENMLEYANTLKTNKKTKQ